MLALSNSPDKSEDLPHKSGIKTPRVFVDLAISGSEDLPHKSGIKTLTEELMSQTYVGRLAPQIGD